MFSRLEGRRVCACKPGYREDRDLCLINPDAGQHTGVTSYPLGGEEGGGWKPGYREEGEICRSAYRGHMLSLGW